jgi:hypothetical protein
VAVTNVETEAARVAVDRPADHPLRGVVIVVAVLLGIAVGIPIVNELVSPGEVVAPGDRFEVQPGVDLVLSEGWTLDRDRDDEAEQVLVNGPVQLTVTAAPADDSTTLEVAELERDVRRRRGLQVFADATAMLTQDGASGQVVEFHGDGSRGLYAVVVAGGVTVHAIASGPSDAFAPLRAELDVMLRSIRLTGAR